MRKVPVIRLICPGAPTTPNLGREPLRSSSRSLLVIPCESGPTVWGDAGEARARRCGRVAAPRRWRASVFRHAERQLLCLESLESLENASAFGGAPVCAAYRKPRGIRIPVSLSRPRRCGFKAFKARQPMRVLGFDHCPAREPCLSISGVRRGPRKLVEDHSRTIKAVMVVHNETSTGVTSRVGEIRKAIDALFLVDTISSLGSAEYRHDEWGVDVTVSCSQKGLMLPPGLGFTAISNKALAASKTNRMPRSYWDWQEMLKPNANGFFPYTPATNLLYGLREALTMVMEEGLDQVFARHQRLAAATRAAVRGWGLEILCQEPAEYSPVLTAVLMPPGHDAEQFRKVVLDNFNMSLGAGLSKLAGKVFRIGHLGECNDLVLLGALTGVEMGLAAAGVPHRAGGVAAAMRELEAGGTTNAPPLRVVR